jgi:hypothetical protein
VSRFVCSLENKPLSVCEFDKTKLLQRFHSIFKLELPDYVSMRRAGRISDIVYRELLTLLSTGIALIEQRTRPKPSRDYGNL